MSNNHSAKGKIKLLKDYFIKRPDVAMAFVFGSQVKKRIHSGSDWDIAVYFKPKGKEIEKEDNQRDYTAEDRVWHDCMEILKTDNVDLIVLNRAAASIADVALRSIPLVVKDRRLFIEFMLRITSEAIDFRRTAQEYAAIYWRSQSLTEQDAYALNR